MLGGVIVGFEFELLLVFVLLYLVEIKGKINEIILFVIKNFFFIINFKFNISFYYRIIINLFE